MKRTLFFTLFLLLAMPLLAQEMAAAPPAPPAMEGDEMSDARQQRIQERIESMRIWKLTEALNLDAERSAVFFPRYRAYLAQMDSIDNLSREASHEIQSGIDGKAKVDYMAQIERMRKTAKAEINLRYEFLKQNKDLLSDQEQAAFLLFERRFNQRLRDVMRDVHMEHGPPPGMPGPPGSDSREWRDHSRGRGR